MEENIFSSELGKKVLALVKAGFKVSDLIPDLVLREKIKRQVLEIHRNFSSAGGGQGKNYAALINEIDALDHLFYLAGHLDLAKEEHIRTLRNGFLVFKSHLVLANPALQLNGGTGQPAEVPVVFPAIEKIDGEGMVKGQLRTEIREWRRGYEKVKTYPMGEHYDCMMVMEDADRIFKNIEKLFGSGLEIAAPALASFRREPERSEPIKSAGIAKNFNEKSGGRQEKLMARFAGGQDVRLGDLVKLFPDISEKTVRNDLAGLIAERKITRQGRGSGSFYRLL